MMASSPSPVPSPSPTNFTSGDHHPHQPSSPSQPAPPLAIVSSGEVHLAIREFQMTQPQPQPSTKLQQFSTSQQPQSPVPMPSQVILLPRQQVSPISPGQIRNQQVPVELVPAPLSDSILHPTSCASPTPKIRRDYTKLVHRIIITLLTTNLAGKATKKARAFFSFFSRIFSSHSCCFY